MWRFTLKITFSPAKRTPKDCKLLDKWNVAELNIQISRKYHKFYFQTIRITSKHAYLYKRFHEISFLNVRARISPSPFQYWHICAFSSPGPVFPSRFLADPHGWNATRHILRCTASSKMHLFQKLPNFSHAPKKNQPHTLSEEQVIRKQNKLFFSKYHKKHNNVTHFISFYTWQKPSNAW